MWRDLDPSRTARSHLYLSQPFDLKAGLIHVLDVPMYFVYRDGKYINALGQSFPLIF